MDSITHLFFSQIIKNNINSDIFDYLLDSNIFLKKFLIEENFIFNLNEKQQLKIPAFYWLHHLITHQNNYLEKEKFKKVFYKHFPNIFDEFMICYLIENEVHQPIFSSTLYPKKEPDVITQQTITTEIKEPLIENPDDLSTANHHVQNNILSAKDEIIAFSNNIYLSEYQFYLNHFNVEEVKEFTYSQKVVTPKLEIKNEIIIQPDFYSLSEILIYHHISKSSNLRLHDNLKLSFEDLNYLSLNKIQHKNINIFIDFLDFPIQFSFSLLGSQLNNENKNMVFDFIKQSLLNHNLSFSWTLPNLLLFLQNIPDELFELDFIFNFMKRLHQDYHFLNKYFFDFIALKDHHLFKDLLSKIQEEKLNLNVKLNSMPFSEKFISLHDSIDNITLLSHSIKSSVILEKVQEIIIQLNLINEHKNINYLKSYSFENYITFEKIVDDYLIHVINHFLSIPDHLMKNKENHFIEMTLKQLQIIDNKLLSMIEIFSQNKLSEMNIFHKFLDEALK